MCIKRRKRKEGEEKSKRAFSKSLLIQESILIWIITIAFIVLAFLCVFHMFDASFMWLGVLPTVAWGAYAVSQTQYYKKYRAENTKDGIVYETAMAQLLDQQEDEEFEVEKVDV